MPNWAGGMVEVTRKRDGVKSFIERFVSSEDDPSTVPGKRFFARSFLCDSRDDVIQNAMDAFRGLPEEGEAAASFYVDFAWSCTSCTIEGYPQKNLEECITLSEACVEDGVYVEIRTSEPGMCFEEHITCDASGDCAVEAFTLTPYKCTHCGEVMCFALFELGDMKCRECGETDFEKYEREAE